MSKSLLVLCAALASSTAAFAQTPAPAPATLRLTVEQATAMALERNVDLKADRLDPQISDTQIAAAAGAFAPSFNSSVQRNDQLQPPTSFLIPSTTFTNATTSSAGLSQKLPRFGTSYSIGWNATHTDSNSILNSYNPLLQSGLSLSVSQPLLRDLFVDSSRQQLLTSRINRDIADTRLRESLVHTTANVKATYWNLVSAIATVDARKSALDLALELVRVNTAKVNVGVSPPLDLVSAQAEAASDEEQLIIAETTVKETEDRLRLLIFDPSDRDMWTVKIEPIDAPPETTAPPNLDAAVATALRERADLQRARKDIETSNVNLRFSANTRLPDVRLNASYQASGLGGTQILREGGFPGTVVGSGTVTDFGSVLNQLLGRDYPTWNVGVSVTYPIGPTTADANYARSRLQQTQSEDRLRSSEAQAISQVRDAAWKIEMNARRIQTTRAARELAEQRLDSERKRFDVGMSTSFLIIQAQRDLAQAKTNELASVLAYDLSLVDFEALQQAGPANGNGNGNGNNGSSSNGQAGSGGTSTANGTGTQTP